MRDGVGFVARPLAAFWSATVVCHLALWWVGSGGLNTGLDSSLGGYLGWLIEIFTFGLVQSSDTGLATGLLDRWVRTASIAFLGTVIAVALAGFWGALAARARFVGWLVGATSAVFASMSVAVVATTLLYWFVIRWRWFPPGVRGGFGDDPAEYLKGLALPSLTVGLVLGSVLVGWLAPRAGLVSAAELADQPGLSSKASRGVPIGTLLLCLAAVEMFFVVPGVFRALIESLFRLDLAGTRLIAGQLLMLGLLWGLVGSFLGDRWGRGLLGSDDDGSQSSSAGGLAAVGVGLGAWLLLFLLAAVGAVTSADIEPGARLAGVFDDGHMLGTDALGRDLLAVLGDGVVPTAGIPLGVGLLATMLALAIWALARQLGPAADWLASGPVHLAGWLVVPVVVLVSVATAADRRWVALVLVLVLVAMPSAVRLLHGLAPGAVNLTSVAGVWFLVSGWVFAVLTVLSTVYLMPRSLSSQHWYGTQIREASSALAVSTTPSVVFGLAVIVAGLALRLTGAGLVSLGARRVSQRPVPRMPPPVVPPQALAPPPYPPTPGPW